MTASELMEKLYIIRTKDLQYNTSEKYHWYMNHYTLRKLSNYLVSHKSRDEWDFSGMFVEGVTLLGMGIGIRYYIPDDVVLFGEEIG